MLFHTAATAAAVGILLDRASAIRLVQPRGAASVVGLSYEKQYASSQYANKDAPSDVADLSMQNQYIRYFSNITIGTPNPGTSPQTVSVQIDTGSSILWVESAKSEFCSGKQSANPGGCSQYGVYDANSSSTSQYLHSNFHVRYGDGTFANGDVVTDVVQIGGLHVTNLSLGIGYNTTANPVWGIGYSVGDYEHTVDPSYLSTAAQMAKQGLIKSTAYSIWLNSLYSNTGSLLFGGVDTAKFVGSLTTVPIVPDADGSYTRLRVELDSVSLGGKEQLGNKTSVVLDSGSAFSTVPQALFDSINQTLGGLVGYLPSVSQPVCPCSLSSRTDTLDFKFGTGKISVPFSEMCMDPKRIPNSSSFLGTTPPADACIWGMSPQPVSTSGSETIYLLGDTMMRSGYFVFDLDTNQISLAQTNFKATDSNIQEIGASGVATGLNSTATTTGSPDSGSVAPSATPSQSAAAGLHMQISYGMGLVISGFSVLYCL